MRKGVVKKHQRYFVNKFRKYHIDADAEKNAEEVERFEMEQELTEAGYSNTQYNDERVMDMAKDFDETVESDRYIFFQLTGIKLCAEDDFFDAHPEIEDVDYDPEDLS